MFEQYYISRRIVRANVNMAVYRPTGNIKVFMKLWYLKNVGFN